ncbi:VOC family protein [Acidicapsa dinghuensis]|uniref:VOC family protein n=1 Tax=Acidicapsa dinghuensis TaxID=2218256 RepID=A0ABW1ERE4_9BACT|nr:VOC family protein [Acidicapsa dinghuensis]
MTVNRSVPTDTVLPHVVYRCVPDALCWLNRVFGFVEHYRYGEPGGLVSGAQVFAGSACIMISRAKGFETPAQVGFRTQMLTVFVEDVDTHYTHTREEGARIIEPLHETIYGERQYGVEDIDGHHWLFSQHSHDISPEQWGAVVRRAS